MPELQRLDPSRWCTSSYGDSFEDTTLESELAERVSAGSSSPAHRPTRASARRSTARSPAATTRSLVSDAHTTEDFTEYGLPPADKVIAHTNMYWTWQDGPGRTASVVETADVDFSAAGDPASS